MNILFWIMNYEWIIILKKPENFWVILYNIPDLQTNYRVRCLNDYIITIYYIYFRMRKNFIYMNFYLFNSYKNIIILFYLSSRSSSVENVILRKYQYTIFHVISWNILYSSFLSTIVIITIVITILHFYY